MSKNIIYLILCNILLLYCCGERNPIPSNNNSTNVSGTIPSSVLPTGNDPTTSSHTISSSILSKENKPTNSSNNTTHTDLQIHISNKTIQQKDIDDQKFDALDSGLEILAKTLRRKLFRKYLEFSDWISTKTHKKKELADAFTTVYDFLNEQKIKQSSNLTDKQLIINTIKCYNQTNRQNLDCNDKNDIYYHVYASFNEDLNSFFDFCLNDLSEDKQNEEIFQKIKSYLLYNNSDLYLHIKSLDPEKIVKLRFNELHKQDLDFLKAALNNENQFHAFLMSDENKIKVVLAHIDSELSNCNGDDTKTNTFKEDIKNYFDVIDEQKLDLFRYRVKMRC